MDKYGINAIRASKCIESYWCDLVDISNKYPDCNVSMLSDIEGTDIFFDNVNEIGLILNEQKEYRTLSKIGDIELVAKKYEKKNTITLKELIDTTINYPDKVIIVCEGLIGSPVFIESKDELSTYLNSCSNIFKLYAESVKLPTILFDCEIEKYDFLENRNYQNVKQIKK